MKYYIGENGSPVGPFTIDELRARGVTLDTLVWQEGMLDWKRARNVPELASALSQGQSSPSDNAAYMPPAQRPQPDYSTPQYGNLDYGQPQQSYGQPQQSYGQSQPAYGSGSPYAQPQYAPAGMPAGGAMPKTWVVESGLISLFSLLCCCSPISLITGIVAIVFGSQVKGNYNRGDLAGAERSSKNARTWFLISLGVLVLFLIVVLIIVVSNPEFTKGMNEAIESVGG